MVGFDIMEIAVDIAKFTKKDLQSKRRLELLYDCLENTVGNSEESWELRTYLSKTLERMLKQFDMPDGLQRNRAASNAVRKHLQDV